MNKHIEVIKHFVEGKISVADFVDILHESKEMQEQLTQGFEDRKNYLYLKKYNYNLTAYIESQNINTIIGQFRIHVVVSEYLKNSMRDVKPTDYYDSRFVFLLNIQPQFLYSSDNQIEEYLEEKVIKTIPEGLSKTKRIQYCKAKIKELFRCEKSYPYWLQNCEWPFNGKGEPMVFQYQKKKKEGDFLKYLYYFKDIETGEVVEVEQYD
jgi:hypothetical protein